MPNRWKIHKKTSKFFIPNGHSSSMWSTLKQESLLWYDDLHQAHDMETISLELNDSFAWMDYFTRANRRKQKDDNENNVNNEQQTGQNHQVFAHNRRKIQKFPNACGRRWGKQFLTLYVGAHSSFYFVASPARPLSISIVGWKIALTLPHCLHLPLSVRRCIQWCLVVRCSRYWRSPTSMNVGLHDSCVRLDTTGIQLIWAIILHAEHLMRGPRRYTGEKPFPMNI